MGRLRTKLYDTLREFVDLVAIERMNALEAKALQY